MAPPVVRTHCKTCHAPRGTCACRSPNYAPKRRLCADCGWNLRGYACSKAKRCEVCQFYHAHNHDGLCRDCRTPIGWSHPHKPALRCVPCWTARNRAQSTPSKIAYRRSDVGRKKALERWYAKGKPASKRDPLKHALKEQRRRARLKDGCSPGVSPSDWLQRQEEFGHVCAYCLKRAQLTIDHVVSIALGGRDEIENVVPACLSCNASKGPKTLLEWVRSGGFENRAA